jgi:hypothetical protein
MIEIDNDELERRAELMTDYGGVQPMHKPFYTYSVRYSAERALAAFSHYDYLLKRMMQQF